MEAFAQFVPLILIFAIMYFLLIRPQQRKLKDHKKMVESLRRGDMIVTQGGLIGKVTKVKEDNELEVELSEGVKVRVCLLYTSPSPRDDVISRMPSSA